MSFKNYIYKKFIPLYRKLSFDQKKQYDKIALKYMSSCKKIVDVGCGTGRFISNYPSIIKGIDQNQESVETCLKKGYDVVKADVTKLPFEDNSFDGVHCSHVIEHLQPKEAYKLLSELLRVLKKDGILVIRTPILYNGFYDDFTHVKPYHPKALLHYLTTYEKSEQTTLTPIKGKFKVLKLKYRKAPLFLGILDTHLFFIFPLFNFLYRFGISSLKKTGYMIILKKIE
ncbi:hypothetical protein COY26_02270 [Candidatus Woesearchaeota archaeon CG_4_10_14_0_2_um_filter_33_10]|nr:MAG: hypothetical protein COY26_02270 [Candidatus Woesearchaeota archaeon CG_4_10_14_0_2_um_filter_33_10]